jgi:predicted DNA-binding transcriptional regulator AlpA
MIRCVSQLIWRVMVAAQQVAFARIMSMTLHPDSRRDQPAPWVDTVHLAWHLCISTSTVDNWVLAGILPPPRKHGGKLMWRWSEVDTWLATPQNDTADAVGMRDAVRREREADEGRAGRRK